MQTGMQLVCTLGHQDLNLITWHENIRQVLNVKWRESLACLQKPLIVNVAAHCSVLQQGVLDFSSCVHVAVQQQTDRGNILLLPLLERDRNCSSQNSHINAQRVSQAIDLC